MKRLEEAAANLIINVMKKHDLSSIDELICPDMRALAEALRPRQRKHGPSSEKKGIGIHSNMDFFRGK